MKLLVKLKLNKENNMRKLLVVASMALLATGCATNGPFAKDEKIDPVEVKAYYGQKDPSKDVMLSEPNMPLKLDKEIRRMSREEIIVAIQECKEADLRPLAVRIPAKINNFETKVIVDVICGPKFKN